MSEAASHEWPARFADDSEARAVGYAGDVLRVHCERAYPPGRPLTLRLQLPDSELTVQAKSAGSKRRDDGRYDVTLRLHSLRRVDRERLERAFGAASDGAAPP